LLTPVPRLPDHFALDHPTHSSRAAADIRD
jgi:hypothetical protein